VRLVTASTVALVLAAGLAGCGRDASVSTGELATRLQDREGFSEQTAWCLARRVVRGYGDAALQRIHDEGLAGVPHERWNVYFHAAVACSLADDPIMDP